MSRPELGLERGPGESALEAFVAEVRPKHCELYRIQDLQENGKLYFHFVPAKKTWELFLIYSLKTQDLQDLKRIQKEAVNHSRPWSMPKRIQLLVLHATEERPSGVETFASGSIQGTRILHHLDEKICHQVILGESNPGELRDYPLKTEVFKFLMVFLGLVYGVQMISDWFYPDPNRYLHWGVNVFNWVRSSPLHLGAGIFMHGGIVHLMVNLLGLHYLGGICARFYSGLQFLILYLVSGICGMLASLAFVETTSVGASGALFGLLGGAVSALLILRSNERGFYLFQFNQLLRVLIVLVGINCLIPFVYPRIDVWGHLGGTAGGLLMGSALLVSGWMRKLLSIAFILILSFALYPKIEIKAEKLRFEMQQIKEKMNEEARVLELMNSRILILERRVLTLMGILPGGLGEREKKILEVSQELDRLETETSPLVLAYILHLKQGLGLIFVLEKRIEKMAQWRQNHEKIQAKLMQGYGFTRSKSTEDKDAQEAKSK